MSASVVVCRRTAGAVAWLLAVSVAGLGATACGSGVPYRAGDLTGDLTGDDAGAGSGSGGGSSGREAGSGGSGGSSSGSGGGGSSGAGSGGGSGGSSGASSSGSGGASSSGSSGASSGGSSGASSGGSSDGGRPGTTGTGMGDDDDGGSSGGGSSDAGQGTVFRHPGILVSDDQLQWLKARIASGQDPWSSAFKAVTASTFAAPAYAPGPVANVVCGPNSVPDMGCTAEVNDTIAAYTQALLWYLTGNRANAQASIGILNAWSATVMQHSNSNAPIQAAWAGALFPRAGEILRWTNAGWAPADVTRFEGMLKNVYLPMVINGSPNANGDWELSMAEAAVAIGVFLDDKATFDAGLALWRARIPAYFYLTSDGPVPVVPPGTTKTTAQILTYWSNPTKLVDGLGQPTCKNVSYTQHGIGALINVAETARIQGVDLYSEQAARITAGLELHAQYASGANVASPCAAALVAPAALPTWEIAYNAYVNRLGATLPNTAALLAKIRPTATDHTTDWETLTHYNVGAVGIP